MEADKKLGFHLDGSPPTQQFCGFDLTSAVPVILVLLDEEWDNNQQTATDEIAQE